MPAKTEIYIYYVFTSKYRRKLMTDSVKESIQWAITAQAKLMGIEVIALSILPDHLHIIICLPPDISVAKAAQMLKWRSSVVARKRHHQLKSMKVFWGVRYFARSISPKNLNQARQFVESRQ